MAEGTDDVVPQLPIPIFRLGSKADRFMLYDIDTITWLRREHHILGVLTGTLPQIPQQNVFLGLPLELVVEEVRLLTEKGVAYIVRDADRHQELKESLSAQDQDNYRKLIRARASEAYQTSEGRKEASKAKAKQRAPPKPRHDIEGGTDAEDSSTPSQIPSTSPFEMEDSQTTPDRGSRLTPDDSAKSWSSTPTSSFALMPKAGVSINDVQPVTKEASYALFKYLHDRGYFLSPGLRFGCQFMAYPGDPLRYHSHFLAVSADWEEEVDLLDVIGEGRLGTGVKKGFLLGGLQKQSDGSTQARTFCLEWGGM